MSMVPHQPLLKDAIRDSRETDLSVASRLEVLIPKENSMVRGPFRVHAIEFSWRGVTQRFSALGPMARGRPPLHKQDSVEPGAAGVHLRRLDATYLPTCESMQFVPPGSHSPCKSTLAEERQPRSVQWL